MSLAQFKTDTVAGTKAAADATKEMANEIGYNAGEAKGSLALISEEVGVSIPRHLRTFIADLPGVGAALEAAFSVVAVIALVEVVVKAIEKFEKWRESIEKAAEAGDKVRESTVRMGLEGSEAVDALREKFIQMTQGPVAALSFQLDHVSETLKGM